MPVQGVITDAQLKDRLASLLSKNGAALNADKWDVIVSDSNRSAYWDIVSRLMNRGYTKAQVDAWDRLAEYTIDIGLYWCAIKGGGLEGYDDKFISKLDRRKELDEVFVTEAGVEAAIDEGDIGVGGQVTDEDLFGQPIDVEGDSRVGEVTEW